MQMPYRFGLLSRVCHDRGFRRATPQPHSRQPITLWGTGELWNHRIAMVIPWLQWCSQHHNEVLCALWV